MKLIFRVLPFLFLSLIINHLGAQPKCTFTHYSVEDGLSEGEVLSMHQDRNGFIWFGTFDGLNRFDGVNFKVYKSGFNRYSSLTNNRVDKIQEDDYGYLWILSNNGDAHRFDTQKELFINFKGSTNKISKDQSPIQQIFCFSEGETWLTTENGGCIRIISGRTSDDYKIDYFQVAGPGSPKIKINQIYKDKENTIWILASNGLSVLKQGGKTVEKINQIDNIANASLVPFYSIYEFDENIWFGSGSGDIFSYDFGNRGFEIINTGVKSAIIAIKPLNQREQIVLTANDGFFILNRTTGERTYFRKENNSSIPSNKMISVYVDKFGEAWIETSVDGVLHFDPFKEEITQFKMKTDKTNPNVFLPNFFIFEDKNDYLWVHPLGGGFSYYNRAQKKLEYFYNEPGSPSRRFPNILHSAFSDQQGNLWMCTISRGIEKATFYPDQFKLLQPNQSSNAHAENEVRAIFEDKDNFLWVATRDGLVYLFDSTKTNIGNLRENGSFTSGAKFNALIYTIMQDRKGNIWMGSKGRGVFKLENFGTIKNSQFKITNFTYDQNNPYSLNHDNVYSIFEDTNGRIWVGTYGGGLNYIIEEQNETKFINYNNNLKKYPFTDFKRVRFITADFKNNIWVATTNGLIVFNQNFTNPDSLIFKTFTYNPNDKTSLSNNNVNYIYCSGNNEIYVATLGGGLNKVILQNHADENTTFKSFTEESGAPSDIILSINDDLKGNLWLSSEKGILKFNKKNLSFEIYGKQSGIESKYFSESTGIRIHTGEIIMGFNDGAYYFNPEQVRKSTSIPPIVFTGIQIGGKDINYSEIFHSNSTSDLKDFTLELSHKDKLFSIAYATLDYRNPNNIQYMVKLEGFDQDWHIEHGQRIANYTNLAPGKYIFKVKSTNSDGIWVENERTINIIVHPSFWETKLARFLYVLAFLILTVTVIYIIFTIYKLRHKVEVEQLITNMKLKFFTDISHELRTPLTLISSPVGNILKNYTLEPDIKEQLAIVKSNTDRMLRLVDQILDFRKIQNKKMKLKLEEFGLGEYVSEICGNFKKIAVEKGIELSFEDLSANENVWADKDKVEKIIYNLLSNALKFTPRGKKVAVTIVKNDNKLQVKVSDQGIGVSKEKVKNIFERFVSFNSSNINFQPGTGIGLSLSKELAELHKAELTVESGENEGATFTVSFKLGFSHFGNDTDFVLMDGQFHGTVLASGYDKHEDELNTEDQDTVPLLLIIEDNEELVSFLKIVLSPDFHVIEASNGTQGLLIAKDQIPDIIITDIMMEGIDGLEVARRIKSDETTSHIPVVVLTAKTDLDTQLEALKTGADDYITKPFSSSYLKARIDNILNQRRKLHETFLANLSSNLSNQTSKVFSTDPSLPVIESFDEKLLVKVMEIMEKNMDNSDLTVDQLVSKIGIGRSVFFKKLKSLTGIAPIEFIREVRIKRAAQLIETGEFTISQVTFMVGNNDPRYFSRCFKQKFGMTPSEYKEKYSPHK
ncbi:MAG: two-component regulator propeller domain-containing protein [Lentimicrobiaceae bacterium]|jgi:signal transduction histidine kinase/ligand-binding sensor domain-containing protein/DNA-binding response OmpR family regulator